MKRLVTLAATALLALVASPLIAQDGNMSGAWIVQLPHDLAGKEQRIEQDENTFTRGHDLVGHRMTYTLDGAESRSVMPTPMGSIVILGTAKLVGRQVAIDETVHLPTGERRRAKLTFWLGGDGKLYHNIAEILNGKEQAPIKIVLRRK
jgi:hypothetical protein